MTLSNGTAAPQPRDAEDAARRRKALRIMTVVLIPIAVWTLVGMIVLWPGDVSSHIRPDASAFTTAGVSTEKGDIVGVEQINCDGLEGSSPDPAQRCAELDVQLISGPEAGQTKSVQVSAPIFQTGVEVGQEVVLIRIPIPDAEPGYQFADFSRGTPMLFFLVLFVVAIVVVARLRGLFSVLGLGIAAFILVGFMFPALISGSNPIAVGLVGSSAIMFVVLYAAHGFSTRTTTALLGTLFGLGLAALLGYAATRWGHLTGVSSDDDFALNASAPDLRLSSVVICAIIVASLGALADVTITQASAVWELAETENNAAVIFRRAMRMGRDHIASTVYTVAFATAGASLGALLLLGVYDRPMLQVLQQERFAEEVIRTLVASIGLIIAMPLTTAIGAAVVSASRQSTEIRLQPGAVGNIKDDLVDVNRRRRPARSAPASGEDERRTDSAFKPDTAD